jgi:hypothetical protein
VLDLASVFSSAVLTGLRSSTDVLDLAYIPFADNPIVTWSQTNPSSGRLTVCAGGNEANITLLGQYLANRFTSRHRRRHRNGHL